MPDKPVVFIPGFPASELFQQSTQKRVFPPSITDLLSSAKKAALVELLTQPDPAPPDIVAGPPIRRVLPIAKQAESLYDLLRSRYGYTIDAGDNFRAIGWDWRHAVDDSVVQTAITNAIAELVQATGRRVVVIIHSTGGLVFRRLLESQPQLVQQIEQVLAFGIPWAGNLKAFRYLTEGAAIGPFFAKLTAAQTKRVMRRAQAAYDLCPPDPATTALVDRGGAPLNFVLDANGTQIGPMTTTPWIRATDTESAARAQSAHQRLGTRTSQILLPGQATPPITNVVGWGLPTEVLCVMQPDGKVHFQDGVDGDGTVALKAATWLSGPTVQTFVVPIGVYPTAGIPNPHPRIWDSPPVEQLFDLVLKPGTVAEPFVCAAADGDEALDRNADVTVRIVAADVNGAPLPNARALARLPQPVQLSFGNDVRATLIVRRGGAIRENVPRGFFRFTIDVEWGANGRRELPMLIRV